MLKCIFSRCARTRGYQLLATALLVTSRITVLRFAVSKIKEASLSIVFSIAAKLE